MLISSIARFSIHLVDTSSAFSLVPCSFIGPFSLVRIWDVNYLKELKEVGDGSFKVPPVCSTGGRSK